MRPTDFYALPTLDSQPWYETHGRVERFFDDPDLEWAIDESAAKAAGADALVFERKLFADVDGERTVTYAAIRFEGRYLGLLVTAGRGEQDQETRLITDLDAYRGALAYVERFLKPDARLDGDVVDPQAEADILLGTYNHAVVEHAGEVRLVDVDHLGDDGTLLFDEKAYRAAFDRIVRPAFLGEGNRAAFQEGIRNARMQELTIRAILESMPPGIPATDAFEEIPTVDGVTRYQGWSPVLVSGNDATYAIGLGGMASHFAWNLGIEKVGPPEMYDELTAPAAPAP